MTAKQRQAICRGCPHKVSTKLGDKCALCGCFIALKVMGTKPCPIGKW